MSLLTRLGALAVGLPRATHEVVVERDLRIPMDDGVLLVADRYLPADRPEGAPLLVTRTPYGRGPEGVLARLYAERGFQVLLVSCRGTFGSGGRWEAFFHEREDGLAVLRWALAQAWAGDQVGLYGASYVGFTQWAVATEAPPEVRAIAPTVTSAKFRELFYPGGSYGLESSLTWVSGLDVQHLPFLPRFLAGRRAGRAYPQAVLVTPISATDRALVGRQSEDFQDWIAHEDPDDPYWKPIDFRQDLRRVPPASLVAGWYDIFCGSQLADHAALRAAGRPVRLTVGPWTHGSPGGAAALVRESFLWLSEHLEGTSPQPGLPAGARVFVLGADRWVQLPDWPPASTPTTWHLHAGGVLSAAAPAAPAASAPDRYRYDPADPTPSAGGGSLRGKGAGPRAQAVRESRADVLTYTSAVLDGPLTIMGTARVTVHLRSSVRHTDVFVRLCTVDPKGRSTNLTDGVRRLGPDELPGGDAEPVAVEVDLSPIAATFLPGHRVRLQVSSGAHPLYARNPGSGEPLAAATTFVVADQEVLHDPAHPSSLELPVVDPVPRASRLERWRTRRA